MPELSTTGSASLSTNERRFLQLSPTADGNTRTVEMPISGTQFVLRGIVSNWQ